MSRSDGGPAYPVHRGMSIVSEGKSLLDEAALAAMPIVADNHKKGWSDSIKGEHFDSFCDDAYALGAAFLRARQRAADARKAAETDPSVTFEKLP